MGGEWGEIEPDRLDRAVKEFEALAEQVRRASRAEVPAREFEFLAARVRAVEAELPGLLPAFNPDSLRGQWPARFGLYNARLVSQWLEVALAILRSAARPIPKADSTVAEKREALERQLTQLQRTLGHLLSQKAIYAPGEEPVSTLNQIQIVNDQILRVQTELASTLE